MKKSNMGCNPCVKCRYAYVRGGIVCCSAYNEVFKSGELPQKPCPGFKGYLPSNIIVFETNYTMINSLGKSKEI